jgi:hypothetical protein
MLLMTRCSTLGGHYRSMKSSKRLHTWFLKHFLRSSRNKLLTFCLTDMEAYAKIELMDRLNACADVFGARIPRDGFFAAKTSAEVGAAWC